VEALEYAYPFRVRRYSFRRGSGGRGAYPGGEGIVREIELLTEADATMLSDRRRFRPYGLAGGMLGKPGRTCLLKNGRRTDLPSKCRFSVGAGERILVETPGGGGWGAPNRRTAR